MAEPGFEPEVLTPGSMFLTTLHLKELKVGSRSEETSVLKETSRGQVGISCGTAQSVNSWAPHRGRQTPCFWRCLHSVAPSPEDEHGVTQCGPWTAATTLSGRWLEMQILRPLCCLPKIESNF